MPNLIINRIPWSGSSLAAAMTDGAPDGQSSVETDTWTGQQSPIRQPTPKASAATSLTSQTGWSAISPRRPIAALVAGLDLVDSPERVRCGSPGIN